VGRVLVLGRHLRLLGVHCRCVFGGGLTMTYMPDKTQPRAVRHALVVVEGIRDAASAGIERGKGNLR